MKYIQHKKNKGECNTQRLKWFLLYITLPRSETLDKHYIDISKTEAGQRVKYISTLFIY